MRIFVYEYATGGGLWHESQWDAHAVYLREGRAMVQALTNDCAVLARTTVVTTRDARLPPLHPPTCVVTEVGSIDEECAAIKRLSCTADWTILIAPETDNRLLARSRFVESAGGRLLSPPSSMVAVASSKHSTAELLAQRGVPVPRGVLLSASHRGPFQRFAFPCVIKPDDGCGSADVRRIDFLVEFEEHWRHASATQPTLRVEEWIPGLAASVAILCGPAGNHALAPCEQRLSQDGRFSYLGGCLPLPRGLHERAQRLAIAAVSALDCPIGYVGVDLVLGDAADGSGDRVIEINPRMTTSYVGLRAASRTNLVAAMIAVAEGRTPDLCFDQQQIQFSSSGEIWRNT